MPTTENTTETVLLVPTAGDPHRLLAPGQAGAMPPRMCAPFEPEEVDVEPGHGVHVTQEWACPHCGATFSHYRTKQEAADGIRHYAGCRLWSLVLVLDGEPVPEGCDRAARVISTLHIGKTAPYTIRSFAPLARYDLVARGYSHPYGVMDLVDAWRAAGAQVVTVESAQ